MKRVILSLFLVLSVTLSFAQKKNVNKAKNLTLMENPDYKAAREAITPALTDSTTMNDANTWFVAASIGNGENEAFFQKMVLGQEVDRIAKGKAMLEAYNYYLKAYELDFIPDKKGKVKPKFTKTIKEKVLEYYKNQVNFIGYGAAIFEQKDYAGAVDIFEVYMNIPNLKMFEGEKFEQDSTFKMIKYYTAIAATNAQMTDKAISYYEDLKDDNYESLNVYQLLYEQYRAKGDTVKFVDVLKEGFEKFPEEAWFLQNLINYYIFAQKSDEAMVYLNKAVTRDPNNPQYLFVMGNLEESKGNFEGAKAAFEKALAADPDLADAWAGVGRLIFNKAVQMADAANLIKENKPYLAAKKKADDEFAKSLPYFEKAKELNPDDMENLRTLRTLYYRLKMDSKYDAISKELGM